jgi:hypothetical protein
LDPKIVQLISQNVDFTSNCLWSVTKCVIVLLCNKSLLGGSVKDALLLSMIDANILKASAEPPNIKEQCLAYMNLTQHCAMNATIEDHSKVIGQLSPEPGFRRILQYGTSGPSGENKQGGALTDRAHLQSNVTILLLGKELFCSASAVLINL